jgi:hypothetical protein
MQGWALATTATLEELEAALRATLAANGFEIVSGKTRPAQWVALFAHRDEALACVYDVPSLTLARKLHAQLGRPARYLEMNYQDASVSATLTELPDGPSEDLDEYALEILNDWNEGEDRKFISEGYEPLVLALLEFPDLEPARTLRFASTASPRVAQLVRAIQDGATWERTEMSGRPAIRIRGADGARIAVLSPEEDAELMTRLAPTQPAAVKSSKPSPKPKPRARKPKR